MNVAEFYEEDMGNMEIPFATKANDAMHARAFVEVLGSDDAAYERAVAPLAPPEAERDRIALLTRTLRRIAIARDHDALPGGEEAAVAKAVYASYGRSIAEAADVHAAAPDPLLIDPEFRARLAANLGTERGDALLAARRRKNDAFSRYASHVGRSLMQAAAEQPPRFGDVLRRGNPDENLDVKALALHLFASMREEHEALTKPAEPELIASPGLRFWDPMQSATRIRPYQRLARRVAQDVVGNRDAVLEVASVVNDYIRTVPPEGEHAKPLVMLLPGPTGTGKTMLAEVLAKALETELVKFNMGEFHQPQTASNLTGAAKGLVGADAGSELGNTLRAAHAAGDDVRFILFDEVEKADPSIWQSLLAFFEKGQISDAVGRVTMPKKMVIVMTSNLLAKDFVDEAARVKTDLAYARKVLERNSFFSDEFMGRVQSVVPMLPLSDAEYHRLVRVSLQKAGAQHRLDVGVTENDLATIAAAMRGRYEKAGTRGVQTEFSSLLRRLLDDEDDAGTARSVKLTLVATNGGDPARPKHRYEIADIPADSEDELAQLLAGRAADVPALEHARVHAARPKTRALASRRLAQLDAAHAREHLTRSFEDAEDATGRVLAHLGLANLREADAPMQLDEAFAASVADAHLRSAVRDAFENHGRQARFAQLGAEEERVRDERARAAEAKAQRVAAPQPAAGQAAAPAAPANVAAAAAQMHAAAEAARVRQGLAFEARRREELLRMQAHLARGGRPPRRPQQP